MRLRTRLRKSLSLIWLATTLLLSVAVLSVPVSAQATTKLTVDSVIDAGLTPGSTFTIYIWVWDVEAMFGYNFFVYYNTSVLTATSFMRYPPFTIDFPSDIDDALGVVALAASMPSPELVGFYWSGAYPIASIDFTVDAEGTSLLDLLSGSVISDIHGDLIIHTVVDGYFSSTGEAPHDVAVTAIQVSPTRDITPGEPVSVNVTVANQGPNEETFTLTTYANSTEVGFNESVSLPMLSETIVTFQWDTTGVTLGHYTISANASTVPEETDTDDNTLIFDDIVVVGTHDVAVAAVTATPTNVIFGEPVNIDVTVANEGNFTETFNVTAKYGYLTSLPPDTPGETVIETKKDISLDAGTSTTLTFTWDTSDVKPSNGVTDLWIVANASKADEPAVPYEIITANNDEKFEPVSIWREPATLQVDPPVVVDPSLAPGQTFSMNITVANVENMLAYDFFLYYNNIVLNATSLTSYLPFTEQVHSTINNNEGWVHMNYTTIPENALTTAIPTPIAGIDFNVTDMGESLLDLRDPRIRDRDGRDVPLIIAEGYFRNVLYIHDISVQGRLETPLQLYLGDSSLLNVTVNNYGLSDETDVELQLLINGTVEDFVVISELLSMASYTWSYVWHPTVEGVYNITAYVPPVVDEQYTDNNNETGMVNVILKLPTASFTVSPTVPPPFEGETVTFDASASSSEESTITSYKWDFDDENITEVDVPVIKHVYTTKGTYNVTLTVTDARGQSGNTTKPLTVYRRDVAVLSVTPSATEVIVGKSLTINVVVANQGDYGTETFNVTVYYDTTAIETKTVDGLAIGTSEQLSFSWDTSGIGLSTYTLEAVAANVTGESNLANNRLTSDSTVAVVTRNVAVTNVEASPIEVTAGDMVTISVTVVNEGNFTETFDVTVYYDNTSIQTKTVTDLAPSASQTLSFSWNTTGVNPDDYSLKGVASPVPDEVDETDNSDIGSTVTVKPKPEPTTPQDNTLVIIGAAIGIGAAATVAVYALKKRKRQPT